MSAQSPSAVVLVRQQHFFPNEETAADNAFQSEATEGREATSQRAVAEMDALAEALRGVGVTVHVFEDGDSRRPDSVFPNNWFSTHPGGYVGVYPMYPETRRLERRADVMELLKSSYRVRSITDYSGHEADGVFLEGTGAMVIDHDRRVVYCARSNRAHESLLEQFCSDFGYEPLVFDASDSSGQPVYHTNVIACIGTDVAIFALEMIRDAGERAAVLERLVASGRTVVDISEEQVGEFAGNAIELMGRTEDGAAQRVLAMSARARRSLTDDQVAAIEASCQIVDVDIPTIEMAGGSVRCMIAGVHLEPR